MHQCIKFVLLYIYIYIIPVGGQVDPSSVVGDNLVWEHAQINDTKNKISDTQNINYSSPWDF